MGPTNTSNASKTGSAGFALFGADSRMAFSAGEVSAPDSKIALMSSAVAIAAMWTFGLSLAESLCAVAYPPSRRVWKNSIAVVQTCGDPPKVGRRTFAASG